MRANPKTSLGVIFLLIGLVAQFPSPVAAQTGPVGHWQFNEGSGTIAGDSSGNGNFGMLVNRPVWTTGFEGSAVSLDGADDYIEIGNAPALNPANALTLSVWVNPANLSSTQMVVAKYKIGLIQYFIRVQPGGRLRFSLNAGGAVTDINSNAIITANAWHHIAGTYDGTQMRLYVDGVLDSFASKTGTMSDNGSNFNLGRHENNRMLYEGALDDVRIYDRALSDTEILALINPGTGDTTPPVISNIATTGLTSASVTITWDTDEQADSEVEYGLDTNYGQSASDPALTTGHAVGLSGLSADTTYHFRVISTDDSANTATSGDNVFTTPPVTSPPTMAFTQPSAGTTITGPTVDVTYVASGDLTQADHAHLQLDSNLEVMDHDFDGFFQFTNVPAGPHTLTGYLATLNHSKITGTDASVSFTTVSDTTPPTIVVTAPVDGATVSGTISFAAAASDDVAVAGVQFRIDGTNVGAEDTTSPYSVSLDTTTLTDGPYTLTAEARDTSNNMATSLAVAISVDNSLSAGLMAEWRFDDGSGVTAADSSGNGNSGALLNGPAWVTGITNGGLSFDGVDDAVEVANDPDLNPTNALTLSAWVNTNNLSSTQMVVAKYKPGLIQYFIRIQSGGRLRFSLNAGGGVTDVNSNAALTVNTWHHMAGTYDGSQMQFYIDGVPDAFASKSGPMTDNGSNVNIGRHENNVMFFEGLLDEVRIYNRALGDTEVLALYNAGIQPPPVDTTPPTVFVTSPTAGSTVSSTITVTADASDNVGVAGVQFTLDGANLGAEDTTAPYSVTWDTTSTANGSHTLSAVARDLAGNTNTASGVAVTVDNPVDTTPPIISGVSATSLTPSGATIAWTTNEATDSQVEYGVTTSYGFTTTLDPALVTSHSQTLANLSAGTTYHYRVLSSDAAGNPAASGDFTFTTPTASANLMGHWQFEEGSGSIAGDSSGNGNFGTLLNGPAWTAGIAGGGLSFDGVDDAVDVGNNASLNPANGLTLAVWVNPGNLTTTQMVFTKYGALIQYFIRIQSGGKLRFSLNAGGVVTDLNSNGTLTGNAWHHIAGTYDGTEMRFYIDGVLDSSVGKTGAMTDNGSNVQIGRRANNRMFFEGILDDARIYDRALSSQEVKDLYDSSAPTTDPAQVGQWSGPIVWPIVAVHLTLMHTGEVLAWEGHNTGFSHGAAHVWNPTTGAITSVPNFSTNLFCTGHAALPDGRILAAGGHDDLAGILGDDDANLFDPITKTWTALPPMAYRRWYPTVTTMPDGRMLVTSGAQDSFTNIASIPEIYDPTTNNWTQLTGADLAIPFYPYIFVLPDGKVLDAGADEAIVITRTLDIATETWTTIDPVAVDGGSAAMYAPWKIIKSGAMAANPNGGTPGAATTYVLDMTQPSPSWRQTAPMNFPRVFHTLTLLPDGTVAVTGGGRAAINTDPSLAVHEAEIWSPVTETWTTMARSQIPRFYHGTAILLPDASVLVAGSGQSAGASQRNVEIFSPPYLFKGSRPTIASAPSTIQYGATFSVGSPDASNIALVSLIRLGTATHTIDMDQRLLHLNFQQIGSSLDVQAPADANLAPPGYYMLFLVDTNGVPSVASFVHIQ